MLALVASVFLPLHDTREDVRARADAEHVFGELYFAGATGIDPGIRAQIDQETAAAIERDAGRCGLSSF